MTNIFLVLCVAVLQAATPASKPKAKPYDAALNAYYASFKNTDDANARNVALHQPLTLLNVTVKPDSKNQSARLVIESLVALDTIQTLGFAEQLTELKVLKKDLENLLGSKGSLDGELDALAHYALGVTLFRLADFNFVQRQLARFFYDGLPPDATLDQARLYLLMATSLDPSLAAADFYLARTYQALGEKRNLATVLKSYKTKPAVHPFMDDYFKAETAKLAESLKAR
jgi:tetratricopeptide (TPR) repeat protein